MKKKIIIVAAAIVLVLTAAAMYRHASYGGTKGTLIEEIDSSVYTTEDYDEAVNVAFDYFNKNFKGCDMVEIHYVGDEELDSMKSWAKTYDADEVIILESTFTTDSRGGDGSLNPNDTYEGWNWILARDKGGNWKHKDHGYG